VIWTTDVSETILMKNIIDEIPKRGIKKVKNEPKRW